MSNIKKIVITTLGTLAIMSLTILYAGPGLAVGKYTRGAFVFPYALLTEYVTKTSGWHLLFFGLAPFLVYDFCFADLGQQIKIITCL